MNILIKQEVFDILERMMIELKLSWSVFGGRVFYYSSDQDRDLVKAGIEDEFSGEVVVI